jgi:nitrous oxide reductase accessory protein NosL
MSGIVLGVWIMLAFMLPANGWTAEKCYICGLDLSEFVTTRYTIVTRDKNTLKACSFYCAAKILGGVKAKRVLVADYNTGQQIDAKRAVYVIGSAVSETVHKKSWLAFGDENSAKVFILRNGGMSRHFKQALRSMSARLTNKANIPGLLKTQQSPGCLKCHATRKAKVTF